MRRFTYSIAIILAVVPVLSAQSPPEPRRLPPSITGVPGQPLTPVVPTAGVADAKPAAIGRYQNLAILPPETVHAVLGLRTGSEWLSKRQQANGRFAKGVNPTLAATVEEADAGEQALCVWAVCAAARFTGDEKLNLIGSQGVLSLLSLTTDSPDGVKVPMLTVPTKSVGFAAALALAIFELPDAGATLTADALKLCRFLAKQMPKEGMPKADADGDASPGLALQALAVAVRVTGDAGCKDALLKGVTYSCDAYRKDTNARAHELGALLPALTDLYIMTKSAEVAASAFAMADRLLELQATASTVQNALEAGGFPDRIHRTNAKTAMAACGMMAACQLARLVPDATRYARYRTSGVLAIEFLRTQQGNPETSANIDATAGRVKVLGGVRDTLDTKGIYYASDATAMTALAFQRFLESGADVRD